MAFRQKTSAVTQPLRYVWLSTAAKLATTQKDIRFSWHRCMQQTSCRVRHRLVRMHAIWHSDPTSLLGAGAVQKFGEKLSTAASLGSAGKLFRMKVEIVQSTVTALGLGPQIFGEAELIGQLIKAGGDCMLLLSYRCPVYKIPLTYHALRLSIVTYVCVWHHVLRMWPVMLQSTCDTSCHAHNWISTSLTALY